MKIAILFIATLCHAGQSIDLSVNTGSASSPQRGLNQEFRHEFRFHDWTLPGSQKTLSYDSGDAVQVAMDTANLLVGNVSGEAPGGYGFVALAGRTDILVRVQRNLTTMTFDCEFWNTDGSGYKLVQIAISSPMAASSGISFGSAGATAKYAFYRKHATLVPLGSKPPTTYTSEASHTWWPFDNSLADISGNGRTITWTSPSYSATPTTLPASKLKTYGAPTWSNWLSLRAGHPAQLDGSGAFSLADASNTVTYEWQCLSGPSAISWSDRTAAQPTIAGLVRGTYKFQLKVTDAAGQTAATTLDVGSVAMDDNGIIVFEDARLDKLFGPTIAFGRNPWPFQDESSIRVMDYHWAQQGPNGGTLTREWETPKAGTVSFTPGSAILTGTGTNFQVDFCGGGTTPLYDIAVMWNVTNADTSYGRVPKIAPGGNSRASLYILSCDSATQITLRSAWVYSTDFQSGKQYSRVCCGFWISQGDGHTYYDGALAFYAMYYRSGNTKYRDAARFITDGWLGYPTIGWGASIQQNPRTSNLTSLFVRHLIDNDGDSSQYQYLRQFVNNPGDSPPALGVLISDPREDGYSFSWRALQAIFEPDPTEKAEALTYLRDAYTNRWQPQQRANGNYWSNYFENNQGGSYVTTNGSPIVTGTGITTLCNPAVVTTAGTLSANNGSTALTGSGTSWSGTTGKIMQIHGQRSGSYYIFFSKIANAASNTSITLTYPYDGDNGSGISYRITDVDDPNGFYAVWFATTAGVQDQAFYTCTFNSSTQITLDRPYEGTSGAKYAARANLASRGSQPFMMGIIATALKWASEGLAADYPTDSANYLTLADNVGKWLKTYGYYAPNKGLAYGIDFPNCVPFQLFNCDQSLKEDRDVSAEATSAMTVVYEKSPTTENRDFGDEFYGAQWGKLGGPYSDGQWNQYDDVTLYTRGKYLGFAFGMGLSHQWPAARLGGVAAPDLRTYTISCVLPTAIYSTAAKQRVTVKAPTGVDTVTTSTCPAATMDVSVDRRMAAGGQYLRKIEYLTSGDAVIAPGEWQPLGVQ